MAMTPSGPSVSRRTLITGAGAGFVGLTLIGACPTNAHAAAPVAQLSAPGATVEVDSTGTVSIGDGVAERVRLQHFMIKDSVLGQQRTFGGTVSQVGTGDKQAIRIAYTMPAAAKAITVTGLLTVSPHRVHIRWEVTGPDTLLPTGYMFSRTVTAGTAAEAYVPLTRWVRDEGGGVPYEVNDGGVYAEAYADTTAHLSLEGSNPRWTNASWVHSPAKVTGTGSHLTEVDVVLGAPRPAAARTVATQRPVGVEVWTDRDFNLWDDTSTPMELYCALSNGGTTDASVAVEWWARDWSGTVIGQRSIDATVPAGGSTMQSFTIDHPAAGITFTEVSATSTNGSAFARTNLAVLGDHEYGDDDRLGIANYPWLHVPSQESLLALLGRIGVKRVRISYDGAEGVAPADLDAVGIAHDIELGGIPLTGTADDAEAWAATNTAIAIAAGAEHFEVGNELNNPWMQGERTVEYVERALKPVRRQLTEAGSEMKILNAGTGGADFVWLDGVIKAGGWDLIDGLAIHPGRGNFTPDHAPDPSEWQQGENGSYWNYLGSLRKAREIIDSHTTEDEPAKELWLTEAYSCTRPNRWWNDTYRQSAENTLLSIALAWSEGVRAVNWYQLHDSTVHHPQEADPANPEYHYGLMMRDTSPKPSLLAYATAARAFDGAIFERWLDFADDRIRGLQFSTDRGPLSVLWTRTDGYLLNADHGPDQYYAAPEPWVHHWRTETEIFVRAASSTVRAVDAIGRETLIRTAPGRLTPITLDGAVQLFWGLTGAADAGAKVGRSRTRR